MSERKRSGSFTTVSLHTARFRSRACSSNVAAHHSPYRYLMSGRLMLTPPCTPVTLAGISRTLDGTIYHWRKKTLIELPPVLWTTLLTELRAYSCALGSLPVLTRHFDCDPWEATSAANRNLLRRPLPLDAAKSFRNAVCSTSRSSSDVTSSPSYRPAPPFYERTDFPHCNFREVLTIASHTRCRPLHGALSLWIHPLADARRSSKVVCVRDTRMAF